MTLASKKATPSPPSPRRAAATPCIRLASQTSARLGRRALLGSPKVGSCSQRVASDGDISGSEGLALLARVAGRLPRFLPRGGFPSCNSALEQPASAARPWQAAQGKTVARGGPRPVRRPPLLTAGVTEATDILSRSVGFKSLPARCARVHISALAGSSRRAT
jgi:hypothetical protein